MYKLRMYARARLHRDLLEKTHLDVAAPCMPWRCKVVSDVQSALHFHTSVESD